MRKYTREAGDYAKKEAGLAAGLSKGMLILIMFAASVFSWISDDGLHEQLTAEGGAEAR
ncbi:hypothetical protein HMSSN036_91820 [Paenibacillus macerans]|nr:hypothetical protein HMSSN036_91820 [Paenibacillus macerans]